MWILLPEFDFLHANNRFVITVKTCVVRFKEVFTTCWDEVRTQTVQRHIPPWINAFATWYKNFFLSEMVHFLNSSPHCTWAWCLVTCQKLPLKVSF